MTLSRPTDDRRRPLLWSLAAALAVALAAPGARASEEEIDMHGPAGAAQTAPAEPEDGEAAGHDDHAGHDHAAHASVPGPVAPASVQPLSNLAGKIDLSPLRGITVQDGGRRKPLDTFAREKVHLILDASSFQGQDPVHTLLVFLFETDRFAAVEAVKIRNLKLVELFAKEKNKALLSMNEIRNHPGFREARAHASQQMVRGHFDTAVLELAHRFGFYASLGEMLRVIPVPGKTTADAWAPIGQPQNLAPARARELAAAVRGARDAWRSGDAAETNRAIAELGRVVKSLQVVGALPEWKSSLEVSLNRVQPFHWAWIVLLLAVVFLGGSTLSRGKGWLYKPGMLFLLVGLGLAIFGLAARTLIVMRAPVSNLYEATIFATFAAVLVGTIFELSYRKSWFGLAAATFGTLAFLLADLSPSMDRNISPLVPVLRSYWLNIHVTCMLLSYGCFAVAFILGIAYFARWFPARGYPRWSVLVPVAICVAGLFPLFVPVWQGVGAAELGTQIWRYVVAMVGAPLAAIAVSFAWVRATGGGATYSDEDKSVLNALERYGYRVIQVGFLILTTGVILGAVWANESWGRYWGWDPKETWAFITMLFYGAYIHGRIAGWFRGPRSAIWSIIGFYSVLFTFYGVSFVLPGLHSYLKT